MSILVSSFTNGEWKQNSYLIVSQKINIPIIIDPGYEDPQLIRTLEQYKTDRLVILLTHGHIDHIGYVSYLQKSFSSKVYLCEDDFSLVKQANIYAKFMGIHEKIKVPKIDCLFKKDKVPKIFDQLKVKVILTPGHTDGSVCYLIGSCLFSGDLMFGDKPGRFDLPGGNKKKLKESLSKIMLLPPNTLIYPGHGDPFRLNGIKYREIL